MGSISSSQISWSNKDQPSSPKDVFQIRYNKCNRPHKSFYDEAVHVCKELFKFANSPLNIHFTGGVDSEFVARVCLENNIPCQLLIFKYKNHLPLEIFSIEAFKREYPETRITYVDFDEEVFLEKEIYEFAEEYYISEPFVAFEIKRISLTEGFFVIGSGDIVLESNHDGQIFSYESGSLHQSRLFIEQSEKEGCQQFFQSTPEIMKSFLEDPTIKKWQQLQSRFPKNNSRIWKEYLYRSIFPKMQPRKKWTGYEKFSELYLATREQLQKMNPVKQDVVNLSLEQINHELTND